MYHAKKFIERAFFQKEAIFGALLVSSWRIKVLIKNMADLLAFKKVRVPYLSTDCNKQITKRHFPVTLHYTAVLLE